LFLDEIGEMPTTLQAVLLRFLDDWTVRPLGGAEKKVDVFLVSATNAGLEKAVANGSFRADLMFRLNALEVSLPPLGQRTDFAAIVRKVLADVDQERRIDDAAIQRLAECAWPGNIRQLRNVLSRLTLEGSEPTIDLDAAAGVLGQAQSAPSQGSTLHEQHRARVYATYIECHRNVSETARQLGVSRNTIYRALAEQARGAPGGLRVEVGDVRADKSR
jgi:transcriptional regulator of acetoin/glycerol metabolism